MDLDADQTRALAADWLRWHLAAGVDGFVDDQPHDRFAEAEVEKVARAAVPTGETSPDPARAPKRNNPQRPLPEPRIVAQRASPPSGQADELINKARSLAAGADTIDALTKAMAEFDGCALKTTAKSHIFASGNPKAKMILIGDAPEADDDRSGQAFSARPGVLLDAMLKAIGLTRNDVALGMSIPWRPPGNRPPTPHEIALCEPFLKRHIELVAPTLVLSLGTLAAAMLAKTQGTLLNQRGSVSKIAIGQGKAHLIVSLPPAHLLRYPVQKKFAWQDLKRARDLLHG